ncbi:MAG: O-antigen ligase family protein [Anaerolineales bacterium]|uniref:O-antigen ligase family protein n=1 Tax=Promineifilum sp. TaxID=2664178 RepID=UPI001DD82170|nr:O-antigen ligase family protein [Anaerolineales bacterium]MCO5180880.1 O-antigen ligase family protein [Promineifilum sp.]
MALLISRLPLPMAGGLVVGAALLIATLVYPLVGLGVALLLGPFGALEAIILGPTLLDSGQIVLLLTVAAWIGTGLARRRLRIASSVFNVPWILLILIAALSLLDAYSIPLGLIELLKWLEIGLIVWLILDLASDPSRRPTGYPAVMRLVLVMLLAAGGVQACIGIWQFGLRGKGPEHFLVLGRFYRAYGTFEQPNPFGGYMNLIALLAIGLVLGLLVAWIERRRNRVTNSFLSPYGVWLGVALLSAVAGSLGLILSWSRGAWLGFLAGLAVIALFSARRLLPGFLLMGASAVLLGSGLLLGTSARFGPALAVVDRLSGFGDEFTLGDVRGVDINDTNYAVVERLAHWQAAVGMARDDLWTGVGFGNYAAAYSDYDLLNFPDALGHAHNYYLNLLAEVGLPGLLAYLIFWLVLIGQSIWLAKRIAWPERGIVVGLLAAWVALAVHHLVDKLYVNNIYVHLGAMIGLLQLFAWSGFRPGSLADQSTNKRSQAVDKECPE